MSVVSEDVAADLDMCHHIHVSRDPAMIDPPERTRCCKETAFVVRDPVDPYSEMYVCRDCLPELIDPTGNVVFPYVHGHRHRFQVTDPATGVRS